jgi:hypothetical protein
VRQVGGLPSPQSSRLLSLFSRKDRQSSATCPGIAGSGESSGINLPPTSHCGAIGETDRQA